MEPPPPPGRTGREVCGGAWPRAPAASTAAAGLSGPLLPRGLATSYAAHGGDEIAPGTPTRLAVAGSQRSGLRAEPRGRQELGRGREPA